MFVKDGKTYIAFDYGTSKTGVAVGQEETGTATPLKILKMRNGRAEERTLARIMQTWKPTRCIIGIPDTESARRKDREINIVKRVYSFAGYLHRRYGLECHLVDERLTTYTIRRMEKEGLFYQGVAQDSLVAVLLLQEWMRRKLA